MAFDRGDLGRLVFERVEAVLIADEHLDRRQHQHQSTSPSRTSCASAGVVGRFRRCHAADGADEQRRRQEGRDRHVREPVGEGRIEDRPSANRRARPAVDHLEACRRLHPTVGGENPESPKSACRSRPSSSRRNAGRVRLVPAEQHDAEEARFEEEGGQHLVGEQRAGDRGRRRPRIRSSWCRTGRP